MQFIYPAWLETDEDKRMVVHFRDLPECLTDGKNIDEALEEARDALEESIAGRINRNEEIPSPSPAKEQDYLIAVGTQMAAKAALYMALKKAKISKRELARKLHCDEKEARRLLDPHHTSKMKTMELALSTLGTRLVIATRNL